MAHNLFDPLVIIYVIKYLRQRIETDLKNRWLTLFLFLSFLFWAVPITLYNKFALQYLNAYAIDNNCIKWLTLNAFIINNKRSKQCYKYCNYFRFAL